MAIRVRLNRYFWVFASLCASPAAVLAQALPDPTKPPAEIDVSLPQAGQITAPKDSGLQSIIISPARRAAIIDGQTVELGAKRGDARLVEVNEGGVVLEGSQGRQVLALFPGVEIKRKDLPKENDVKQAAQKKKPAKKPAGRTGKKEKK